MPQQKVTTDGLAKAISNALSVYGEGVTEGIKEDVKAVASDCAKEIRNNARTAFKGNGAYAKDWRASKTDENPMGVTYTVHSPRHYMLAHLLENGHAKRSGGRVEGRPHIGPAEQKAVDTLEKKIKERVGNGAD